jgi:hypothetical protein
MTSQHVLQSASPGGDWPSTCTHRSQATISDRSWSLLKLARASACGALALAAAQDVDMRVTGRPGSDTPVRGFEILSRRCVRGTVARTAVGYAVQSSLAPLAAVAAGLAGQRVTRRFAAAMLSPLIVTVIVNPTFGASAWPWHWARSDWTRELTLKSVLAIAIVAALR